MINLYRRVSKHLAPLGWLGVVTLVVFVIIVIFVWELFINVLLIDSTVIFVISLIKMAKSVKIKSFKLFFKTFNTSK